MVDRDLAELYGVSTKRMNEQVRRNIERFPADFMFQLTEMEKLEVVAFCDHLTNMKYSPYLPYVFTEHGAVMLASILKSEEAIRINVQIVRLFNRMRDQFSIEQEIFHINERLSESEKNILSVFKYLKQLEKEKLQSLEFQQRRRIGYK